VVAEPGEAINELRLTSPRWELAPDCGHWPSRLAADRRGAVTANSIGAS
jgi:hypothetical protein